MKNNSLPKNILCSQVGHLFCTKWFPQGSDLYRIYQLCTCREWLNIPKITSYDCGNSPLTRTLYSLKTIAGIHLESELPKFPLLATPLKRKWLKAIIDHLHITHQLSIKLLNKLLLYYISNISHLLLPGHTHLMSFNDFKQSYTTSTKLVKTTFSTLETLVCYPTCLLNCPNPCTIHHPLRTFFPQYVTINNDINHDQYWQPVQPPPPRYIPYAPPPWHITQNSL